MSNELKQDKAGVIIFPPLLYFIALILGILISKLFKAFSPFNILFTAIGSFVFLLGVLLLIISVRTMNAQQTTINPKGATTTIIEIGIFKYSRNPMYISFTLILIGLLICLNSFFGLIILVPLLILVQKGIIEREETYLTQKFGSIYLSYKQRVRRWL